MGKQGMVVGRKNLDSCILSAAECGLTCTHEDVAAEQEGSAGDRGRTGTGYSVKLHSPLPQFCGSLAFLFCFWSVLWKVLYHQTILFS